MCYVSWSKRESRNRVAEGVGVEGVGEHWIFEHGHVAFTDLTHHFEQQSMDGSRDSAGVAKYGEENDSGDEDRAVNSPQPPMYKQWFVVNCLGFAHNISSTQLKAPGIEGTYSGSFLAGRHGHATSNPVYIASDGKVYLREIDGVPMPFPWGRSGGNSKETKARKARERRARRRARERELQIN